MARAAVLVHGFTQTARAWDPARSRLGERYRDLVAVDLRGHGSRGDARPIDFPAVLADLAALPPRRFALAGYSMGGRIALAFAIRHPERVERLVLVGASPGIADDAERAARRTADAELAGRIERDGVAAFADAWGALPLFEGQAPAIAAAAREDRLRNTSSGLAAALRGLGTGAMEPLWGRLGELRMPVVLVVGERDARYREIALRMAAAMPRAEIAIAPGAGHAAILEAPGFVAERV